VRNDVHLYDARLGEGASVDLPSAPGWDTYFYVFDGAVTAGDTHFDSTESGLFVGDDLTLTARDDTLLVAFLIDPDAPVTRQGTVGR
jgi:redox-sensitive bicupin YhaK (pirin superfamily)